MADDRVERILAAAYTCFTRHGVRRTTMDDIAAAAQMSRPAVYQYVRNKDDAFRRLATKLFDDTIANARAAATVDGPLAERLYAILATKLQLTIQLWHDSPHAAELLDTSARLTGDLVERFTTELHALLTTVTNTSAEHDGLRLSPNTASELADIALALTRGLEADLSEPNQPLHQLRRGIQLLVAGLTAQP